MRLEDQEVVKWRGWENRRLREAERITIFKIPILLLKRLYTVLYSMYVSGPHINTLSRLNQFSEFFYSRYSISKFKILVVVSFKMLLLDM